MLIAFVDTETTGLDHRKDVLVEFAAVLFECDAATGKVLRYVDEYGGLQEPTVPISRAAAEVNGITYRMVRGKRLDRPHCERIITSAEALMSHNAAFDRPFVAKEFPIASRKPWLCSMSGIPWRDFGFERRGLQFLLKAHGIKEGSAHRALSDALAAVHLLSQPARGKTRGQTYLRFLIRGGAVGLRPDRKPRIGGRPV